MLFKVLTSPNGSYNVGQGGNPNARSLQRLSERRQLLAGLPASIPIEESDEFIYDAIMSMPPGPDKVRAIVAYQNERNAMPYWYGDEAPRDPTLKSSSSWVGDIEYDPKTEILRMGNYECPATPYEAEQVLNGKYLSGHGSVGRSLMNLWRTRGWGKNNSKGPLP